MTVAKPFKMFLNIILTLVLLFSLYKITTKLLDYKKSSKTYNNLEDIYKENKNNSNEAFLELKKLNPDYKFWIEVENTNISYPVVQGKDNEEYLKKDFLKNPSSTGSIFLDYRNNSPMNFNNIIYGHNMKNNSMFNNLIKFKEKSFFDKNNKITITDENNKYSYEVFSVYTVDGKSDSSSFYSINKDSDSSSKEKYISDLKKKSIVPNDITVSPENQLITLVTCSYEATDTRTIVHGKLISTEKLK